MYFVDPEYNDPWRPSSITEYECLRLDAAAIEEFIVDPQAIINEWFDSFTQVRHSVRKPTFDPKESLTSGYVPRGEAILPVQFQAVMPARSVLVVSRIRKREAQGKLHSWYFREVSI